MTIPLEWRNDDRVMLRALKKGPLYLKYASEELRDYEPVVKAAAEISGYCMRYASRRLRREPSVVMTALRNTPDALRNISSAVQVMSRELLDDKDFVLRIAKEFRLSLSIVSDRLRDDEDVVISVMDNSNGYILHMSERLKEDKDFIMGLMEKVSRIDRFDRVEIELLVKNISPRLRDDEDLIILAAGYKPDVLMYAPFRLRDDADFIQRYLQIPGSCIGFASDRIRADRDIALYAVRKTPSSLKFISEDLQNDYEIVMEAVSSGGEVVLEYVSDELRDDFRIIKAAVEKDPKSLIHASDRIVRLMENYDADGLSTPDKLDMIIRNAKQKSAAYKV